MEESAVANPHITFDQTPETRFYMCSNLACRTHVLSAENFLSEDRVLHAIFCQNPINVKANDVETRWILLHHTVVDVCCKGCNGNLGHKFIGVGLPSTIVQEGRFLFYLHRMLYWNGNRVVYADTNQPVENYRFPEKEIPKEEEEGHATCGSKDHTI